MPSKIQIIVSSIGTRSGKTVVSAILCKALGADYWKPVQAGDLGNTDSQKIARWLPTSKILPEAYRLTQPMSPHAAAELDGIKINEKNLNIPATENNLIIELAGGVMVPLQKNYLNIDWMENTKLPAILVADYYLGSINHTLLSWEALRSRKINLLGIIFNGKKNRATFDVIRHRTKLKCLLEVEKEDCISAKTIEKYAARLIL